MRYDPAEYNDSKAAFWGAFFYEKDIGFCILLRTGEWMMGG